MLNSCQISVGRERVGEDMYRTCNQSQYTRADNMYDYDWDFIGCGLPLSSDQLLLNYWSCIRLNTLSDPLCKYSLSVAFGKFCFMKGAHCTCGIGDPETKRMGYMNLSDCLCSTFVQDSLIIKHIIQGNWKENLAFYQS